MAQRVQDPGIQEMRSSQPSTGSAAAVTKRGSGSGDEIGIHARGPGAKTGIVEEAYPLCTGGLSIVEVESSESTPVLLSDVTGSRSQASFFRRARTKARLDVVFPAFL
jgi:hypothetical protein